MFVFSVSLFQVQCLSHSPPAECMNVVPEVHRPCPHTYPQQTRPHCILNSEVPSTSETVLVPVFPPTEWNSCLPPFCSAQGLAHRLH